MIIIIMHTLAKSHLRYNQLYILQRIKYALSCCDIYVDAADDIGSIWKSKDIYKIKEIINKVKDIKEVINSWW